MLQLVNTGLDSSRMKNLGAHMKSIPLNQDNTFFMNVGDLIGTGTLGRILSAILSCFWRLIQMLLHS